MNNNKGIVYVLTNPVMHGLVKIGMTTRCNVEARMKELYSTGVPVPFECAYACEVTSKDCEKIEKALHAAFEPNRVNRNREFFEIKPEQAIAILELFNRTDVTNEVSAEIEVELTSADKIAKESIQAKRREPNLNFNTMEIPLGSTLTFIKDPEVTVVVASDRKVIYNGEESFLSTVTRSLLNLSYNVAPTRYWEYNGRNLRDIYYENYIDE